MEIDISKFVKLGINVEEGEVVSLVDEGKYVPMKDDKGGTKEVLEFQVEIPNGKIKVLTMNMASQKNMIKEFGKDSKTWIGKPLKIWAPLQMSFGKMKKVLILTPATWKDPTGENQVNNIDIPIIEDGNYGNPDEGHSLQDKIDAA